MYFVDTVDVTATDARKALNLAKDVSQTKNLRMQFDFSDDDIRVAHLDGTITLPDGSLVMSDGCTIPEKTVIDVYGEFLLYVGSVFIQEMSLNEWQVSAFYHD